jgi:DNA replication protein DnaC
MKRVGNLIKIGVGTLRENMPITSSTEMAKSNQQDVCPRCNGLGYVRLNVPIDHPDFGKLVPCTCRLARIAQKRTDALRTLSNLDILEDRMTFETFIPQAPGLSPDKQANLRWAFEEAREFAHHPEGWLLFKGGYGCGKTHLSVAIANACIERGQPALFITIPDLLDHLRATFAPGSAAGYDDRFDKVRTAPVLILDDLGTESSTPWAQEKLFQIFNYRYNARLPTVITTNRELEEISLRLRSRLADPDLARIISITAPDYRRVGIAQDQSDLSSLSLHAHQTFETFDQRKGDLPRDEEENLQQAFKYAQAFAKNPEGWLILSGPYGCGKTHLAAAIANYHVVAGHPALFVIVPDLLDHLRATFNPQSAISFDQRFEEVRRAPLLILDDLGTESTTPWAKEKMHQIFDYRYNARLPTVITTAATMEEIDPRLRTRMLDSNLCKLFAILAPAYRGASQSKRGKRPRR